MLAAICVKRKTRISPLFDPGPCPPPPNPTPSSTRQSWFQYQLFRVRHYAGKLEPNFAIIKIKVECGKIWMFMRRTTTGKRSHAIDLIRLTEYSFIHSPTTSSFYHLLRSPKNSQTPIFCRYCFGRIFSSRCHLVLETYLCSSHGSGILFSTGTCSRGFANPFKKIVRCRRAEWALARYLVSETFLVTSVSG